MILRATGFFDSDGERIYFETAGDGDAVVLSHGLGGNHASWWRVLPALAERHKVVTWDQRGFGNSTRRSGRFGPEPAVQDLLALIDHLRLEQIQLVGQSMGGWVAMGFALQHRERLRSLVLTDTVAGVYTDEISAELKSAAGRDAGRFASDTLGEHRALDENFCQIRPDLAFLYQEISSMGDKPDEAEMFKMLGKMRVSLDDVSRLDLPVLLVVGECDKLCPPAVMQLMAAQIPRSNLEVIPDAGHSPYFEQPERWLTVVRPFLTRHSALRGARDPQTQPVVTRSR